MSTDLIDIVQQQLPRQIIGSHRYRAQPTLVIRPDALLDVARLLRDDARLRFDVLMDVTAVDYLKFGTSLSSAPSLATPSPLPYYMTPKPVAETWQRLASNDEHRFDVVYHFYASCHNHRLRVKVPLASADPVVDSLTGLWASANWYEREVWDMFGIRFTGHPNLTRILMYEGFEGHPLRKDYPVHKRQPLVGPMN